MDIIYILVLITDLGASFTFKHKVIVHAYSTLNYCMDGKEKNKLLIEGVSYMSLECERLWILK